MLLNMTKRSKARNSVLDERVVAEEGTDYSLLVQSLAAAQRSVALACLQVGVQVSNCVSFLATLPSPDSMTLTNWACTLRVYTQCLS